jgi:hypothetical protein
MFGASASASTGKKNDNPLSFLNEAKSKPSEAIDIFAGINNA